VSLYYLTNRVVHGLVTMAVGFALAVAGALLIGLAVRAAELQ
jgi:hypothetical protein